MTKNRKEKFYIVELIEVNGEYEYKHVYRMRLSSRQKVLTQINKVASNWYSGKIEEIEDGYMYNGEVIVTAGDAYEIPEEIYHALEGIIASC